MDLHILKLLYPALLISLSLQCVGFVVAVRKKTERFYDLFGSLTFFVVVCSLPDIKHICVIMVVIWCSRLGTFLTYRAIQTGGDSRFEELLENNPKFAVAWFLQGVWVVVALLPVVLCCNRDAETEVDARRYYGGLVLFVVGFLLEVLADAQKWAFKQLPENRRVRMEAGVWKYVKYPNYTGEIMLWSGIALTAISDCREPEELILSWLSPSFVAFLLVFVSGIPLQEAKKDQYGGSVDTRSNLLPYIF
jgi:steroid 5-alpha reductase family enzyme